ncbi:WD repeat-containing protein 43-like [Lineus longissimus]|uniref:WD repeat-containing protein 43-like n=1 Tax=Lineus longissimus TaxID=88925 RepID=UPI002B4D6F92
MANPIPNSPLSFSSSGEYLAHSSPDGTLKLWQTSTATLSQEYTPSSHLSATCTCINWGPWRDAKNTPKKKKRRKSGAGESLQLVALGTQSGDVLLYSVAKGDLQSQMTDGHSDRVNDISWCQDGYKIFTCSSDRHIVEWDVLTGKIKNKWKGDKAEVYSLCLCPGDMYLLSASRSIKLWDLQKREVLKTFTGHATEVFRLLLASTSQEFSLRNSYVMSAAVNDRLLHAWNLDPSAKDKSALASFALPEEPVSMSISRYQESDKAMLLASVTQNGHLLVFEHVLNGKCKKSLQPKVSIQIATPGCKDDVPRPIPILAVHISCDNLRSLVMVYGNFLKPSIEKLEYGSLEQEVCLVRDDPSQTIVRQESEVTKIKTPDTSREVMQLAPGHMAPSQPTMTGSKKKRRKSNEMSMEDRLNAMGFDQSSDQAAPAATHPPQADTLATLLTQGLQSQDKLIINNVLQTNNEKIIKNTVRRLPVPVVIPLVKELSRRMHGHAQVGHVLIKWVKMVLTIHTSYLMTFPEIVDTLSSLYQMMDYRVGMFSRLSKLQGKLELMLSQVTSQTQDEEETVATQQPMLIYQEESSDEEMDMDDVLQSHSESEDNWEDLSDMEVNEAQEESDEALESDEAENGAEMQESESDSD